MAIAPVVDKGKVANPETPRAVWELVEDSQSDFAFQVFCSFGISKLSKVSFAELGGNTRRRCEYAFRNNHNDSGY